MKKFTVLAAVFMFALVSGIASAAGIDHGISNKVIVRGTPEVTGVAVDAQIRLLEFVLENRFTIAQKQNFCKAIVKEIKGMDQEGRENFNESILLVDSLNKLGTYKDEEAIEDLRVSMKLDFDKSAVETPNDPAAELYLNMLTNANKSVIRHEDYDMSRQSVEAFAEYLAFAANTSNPAWFNENDIDLIETRMKLAFASISDEERESIEQFQYTWYLIRAAWQNSDSSFKNTCRSNFNKIGLKSGVVPGVKEIKRALSVEFYGDLLDKAVAMGIEPFEWSPKTNVRVW